MAAAAEKKKVNLSFGMSKDKLKALAGNTLKDGGMELVEATVAPPGRRGSVSDAFNTAAAMPMQPPSQPRPRKFDI